MLERRQKRFSGVDWFLSFFLALTWGSSFLLIAIAISDIDPFVVPFGRALAGAAALAFFPGALRSVPGQHWPRIALLGLIWMAIPFLLFPLAETTVSSGVAGMINGALPTVMAVVTAIWVRRAPSRRRICAVALGFAGVFLIVLPSVRTVSSQGESVADARGVAYLVMAITCYAIGANIARPLQAQLSPARLLVRVQFASALWSLPLAASNLSRSEFSWSAILSLFALGVMGTGVAFVAFGTLLERTGIARAMIPTYFTPIVGVTLGFALLDESVALLSVFGMITVIVSAWMTSRPDASDVMLDLTPGRA